MDLNAGEDLLKLKQRFPNGPIAAAVAQSRGPLVFLLSKYDHLVIFPIHPSSARNYRKTFRPSGAKRDHAGADLLLDVLSHHQDSPRPLNPDTEQTRTIQLMVEHRRRLVNGRTRLGNRFAANLKIYFPQVLGWFVDAMEFSAALDLLERWPYKQQMGLAICHGIRILAAGLVKDRCVTCYEHVRPEGAQAGGTWDERQAVRDGRIITAQTWQSHTGFYRLIFAALAEWPVSRLMALSSARRPATPTGAR